MEVIPLHLVAYSEELRTHNQAQLVVQVSLAILLVNQVFKHKVFSRRLRVNLHSHNRRFNSLLRWDNPLCRSRIPSSAEVFPRLNLFNRTQHNHSGYSVKKLMLVNLQQLAVDFSGANKHNNRQIPKREVVYLAELSLKAQWVEDFLAA